MKTATFIDSSSRTRCVDRCPTLLSVVTFAVVSCANLSHPVLNYITSSVKTCTGAWLEALMTCSLFLAVESPMQWQWQLAPKMFCSLMQRIHWAPVLTRSYGTIKALSIRWQVLPPFESIHYLFGVHCVLFHPPSNEHTGTLSLLPVVGCYSTACCAIIAVKWVKRSARKAIESPRLLILRTSLRSVSGPAKVMSTQVAHMYIPNMGCAEINPSLYCASFQLSDNAHLEWQLQV